MKAKSLAITLQKTDFSKLRAKVTKIVSSLPHFVAKVSGQTFEK
jgi:hypothetical protein